MPQIPDTLKEFYDQLRSSTDTQSEDEGQYLKVQGLLEFAEVLANQQEHSIEMPINTWGYR